MILDLINQNVIFKTPRGESYWLSHDYYDHRIELAELNMRDYTWSYKGVAQRTGGIRVAEFTRDAREMELKIIFNNITVDEIYDLIDDIEYGIANKMPCELWHAAMELYSPRYAMCYVIGASYDKHLSTATWKLLIPDGCWVSESNAWDELGTHPWVTSLNNISPEPAEFLMKIYPERDWTAGCTDWVNPQITIGENTYGFNLTLTAGHHIEVDSREKTALLITDDGSEEPVNIFGMRMLDGYIFEPIAPGRNEISATGDAYGEGDWVSIIAYCKHSIA